MNPPKHLSAESKRMWRRIQQEYELTPDAAGLLRVALENFDIGEQARKLIQAEGVVVDGKRHPATDVMKQANGLYLRAMRQLGLDIAPPGPIGRPSASV